VSECFQVILDQLHRQRGVSWPAPAIALNAADQPLAKVVDFNERALALTTIAEVVHLAD